jgi:hypothetical protein
MTGLLRRLEFGVPQAPVCEASLRAALTDGQRVLAAQGPKTRYADEFPESTTGQVPCTDYYLGAAHRHHVYRPTDHGPVTCPGLRA